MEDGRQKTYTVMVPKGFKRTESTTDSLGNEQHLYYYSGGTRLYFVRVKDSAAQYQPINYAVNLPKNIYNTTYYKGIDSSYRYWRESRFGNYRLGYYAAEAGEDWKFDSALNYFSLRSVH